MESWTSYFKIMRPPQWIKNGFVLMPLLFSGRLLQVEDFAKSMGIFLIFCLASSITYIINDYMDMDQDRVHPSKRNRPLAAGEISPAAAFVLVGVLMTSIALLGAAFQVPYPCYVVLAAYLILHIVYSIKLKNFVIVDVIAISAGFLLRVVAGAVMISVPVSSWLFLCTFSLAIFLALGKRRHEVIMLLDEAGSHRPVLANYGMGLLDQLLQAATTSTFIFYCLYSVRGAGIQSEKMMLTIPLVAYGLFRYLYLIYQKEDGGSPTALLMRDRPLLACLTVWLTVCVFITYA